MSVSTLVKRISVALGVAVALPCVAAVVPTAEWLRTEEGRGAVENVLSWQTAAGGWPKNQPTTTKRFEPGVKLEHATFDNGATTTELRILARAFGVTRDARCETAFLRGLNHILAAQYPSGGWPQFHPPPAKSYHRHITFNDGTMTRLLELLRDVNGGGDFVFVPEALRVRCAQAFERGVACILRCQVLVDGARTAWCAQHDEVTLEPRPARKFELASLSGGESAGLLRLLMSIERPSPEVRRAIEAGVAWFKVAKVTGLRETRVDGNKVMVKDAEAPPLWARFYEIGTNRPIFAGRDGVKKYSLAEIEAERRNGYTWFGTWGDSLLREYTRWKARIELGVESGRIRNG